MFELSRAHARGVLPPPPKKEGFMDKRETTRLFRLMQNLYPNAVKFTGENAMLAWQLVLEPFSYDDIKAAAIAFARENKYPPDPGDLCRDLMPEKSGKQKRRGAGEEWQARINAGQCADAADILGGASRYARERGLTWQEAKRETEGIT